MKGNFNFSSITFIIFTPRKIQDCTFNAILAFIRIELMYVMSKPSNNMAVSFPSR